MAPIVVLFIGEIILLIFAYIITNRDILAPSVLMCIMFVISTFIAVLNIRNWGNGTVSYSTTAVIFLLSGILCFILAETFTRTFIGRYKENSRSIIAEEDTKTEFLSNFKAIDISMTKVVLVIIIDIIICVIYYYAIRKVVGASYSGFQVFSAYRRLGVSDMAGEDVTRVGGLVSQLTNIVVVSGYIAGYILINNLIAKYKYKKQQWGLVAIILLSVLPGIMTASRTQFLRLFIALVLYYYILWNQKYHWLKNLSKKVVRIGIIALVLGVPAFYYSLNLLGRTGVRRSMLEYVSSYLGSSIYLFGDYVQNPLGRSLWGEESLVGVRTLLSYLGLGSASTSYNLEFRSVGAYTSNVYTFFRRPLHDFGIVGMYIFTILVAVFFAYIYWGKIKKAKRTARVNIWTLVYGYLIYWIFLSSIEQYSQSYISVGALVKIILIILGYWFATKVHLKFKVRSYVLRL